MRSVLAPASVPRNRTRADAFDELVLDAVEELEAHWAAELAGVEFAVEDVPPAGNGAGFAADFDPDVVLDRGVALGRLLRDGVPALPAPTVVVYRRPVEARAARGEERADLVFMVVAELVSELLGKDLDEIDPPGSR